MIGKTPEFQLVFGTQLLAVTQISVPGVTVSVTEFRHGCGATSVGVPSTYTV
jgi:hypothetical protein